MANRGELIEWNDERGFGFIRPDGGNERLFVHISQIGRIATRPQLGDRVSYVIGRGRDGGPAAVSVSIWGANPVKGRALARGTEASPSPAASGYQSRTYFGLILLVLLGIGWLTGSIPMALAAVYLVMSAASAWLYYRDKQSAAAGEWRTSEDMLHGIDLAFGIIGGLVAQQIFRHKTAKRGFAAITYVIAAVHGLWLAGLVSGRISLAELANLIPG
ncbi:MAG: hypothetical protein JWP26_3690 [Devosia sp.]|uniref:DUF1294 domain-containing protein n=1 Tax=Devosia sp. TaxID=1871048 RepID=UPI00260EED82|nr:DUF1294 domain-containing protein [Devosia sp.]MDB5588720.1 hypothetical protein [Devosia sp.]